MITGIGLQIDEMAQQGREMSGKNLRIIAPLSRRIMRRTFRSSRGPLAKRTILKGVSFLHV